MDIGRKGWYSARRVTTIFWVLCVGLTLLQCAAFYHQWNRERENSRQEQSQRVLVDTQELLLDLEEGKAGEERFVITGNERALHIYQQAMADYAARIQAVEAGVAAGGDHAATVDLQALRRKLDEGEAEMAQVIELRRTQGFDVAAARVREGRAFDLLEEVRQGVERLQADQMSVLAQHTANELRSIHNNLLMFLALTAADVLLLAVGYWGINRYAAHRHRAEMALAEAGKAAEAAHAMAVAANHAKDRILQTVSHDLRTPLNGILMWAQLLQRGDSAEAREAGAAIARSAEDQARLVNDLLDASRMERGALRVEMRPVAVEQILRSSVAAVTPMAQAKGVRLNAEIHEAADVIVNGDHLRLQQVFWNLLSNAIKFTPADGSVDLKARRRDGQMEIEVRDTGRGIGEAFLPHLFEAFSQDQAAGSRSEGLGLGLAIVKHLVELHGGAVEARSEGLGKGATFCVRLPIVGEGAAAPATAAAGAV